MIQSLSLKIDQVLSICLANERNLRNITIDLVPAEEPNFENEEENQRNDPPSPLDAEGIIDQMMAQDQ